MRICQIEIRKQICKMSEHLIDDKTYPDNVLQLAYSELQI